MNKNTLRSLINECFTEIGKENKAKKAIRALVQECLNEQDAPVRIATHKTNITSVHPKAYAKLMGNQWIIMADPRFPNAPALGKGNSEQEAWANANIKKEGNSPTIGESKIKSALTKLVKESLNEMGRPRKEDAIPMDVQVRAGFQGKDTVYISDLKGDASLQDNIAQELGFKPIATIGAYVSSAVYEQLKAMFSKSAVSIREIVRFVKDNFDAGMESPVEIADKLAEEFMTAYRKDFDKNIYVKTRIGSEADPNIRANPQDDTPLSLGAIAPAGAEGEELDPNAIASITPTTAGEDEEELQETKKQTLKNLIKESIEEVKAEDKETKTVTAMMDEISKSLKKLGDDVVVEKDDFGDFEIKGRPGHHFRIRAQHDDVFDVTYIKDGSDREKKLNVKFDDLKKFIDEKLKDKEGNYVAKAFNKSSENSEDVTKKESDLPVNKTGVVTKKEVKDAKNDNKDYNEKPDEKKTKQDAPLEEPKDAKKQSDHPVKGTKPDYTQPKEVNKKHVVKGKAANRRFKGLPKTNKKD